MEREFKVGDRVRAITPVGFSDIRNVEGKVIGFTKNGNITVEFDKYINGHNGSLCGKAGKKDYCWYCKKQDLELISNSKDKLIFRDNTTILIKDGKKYVAKCCEGDTYDKEKGLLVCLAKAHGYTFNDLQEMLKGAEYQGNKRIGLSEFFKTKGKYVVRIRTIQEYQTFINACNKIGYFKSWGNASFNFMSVAVKNLCLGYGFVGGEGWGSESFYKRENAQILNLDEIDLNI